MTGSPPAKPISETPAAAAGAPAAPPRRWLRLALLALVLAAIFVAVRASGLSEHLTAERLRAAMERAGALGVVVFIAAFVVGELVHLPGLLFVGVAVAGYGRLFGGALGFLAGVLSVAVSFWLVRAVGGKALAEVESPLMRRLLAPLDRHPIRTVLVLRTIFWFAPPLNYALALSPIRFRDYLIGSAIGLAAPVLAAILLFDRLVGTK